MAAQSPVFPRLPPNAASSAGMPFCPPSMRRPLSGCRFPIRSIRRPLSGCWMRARWLPRGVAAQLDVLGETARPPWTVGFGSGCRHVDYAISPLLERCGSLHAGTHCFRRCVLVSSTRSDGSRWAGVEYTLLRQGEATDRVGCDGTEPQRSSRAQLRRRRL